MLRGAIHKPCVNITVLLTQVIFMVTLEFISSTVLIEVVSLNNMEQNRLEELLRIAEEDGIFQVWSQSYEDCRESFYRFAASQPEEIRNMLYGYADCGRMMMQRMINLACEYMIFPKE